MARFEVMNPVARSVELQVELAPRLPDLKGKTVGLYWNMKAGGDVALDRTAELLKQRFPGVQIAPIGARSSSKYYLGSVGFNIKHLTSADTDRIARDCQAVVGTTAD